MQGFSFGDHITKIVISRATNQVHKNGARSFQIIVFHQSFKIASVVLLIGILSKLHWKIAEAKMSRFTRMKTFLEGLLISPLNSDYISLERA